MQPKLLSRIIKINEKQLEEELFNQKIIISRIEEIKNQINKLKCELEEEMDFAQTNLDMAFAMEGYREDNTLRRVVLNELVKDLQARLDAVREKIVGLNMENKKFEILITQQQKKALKAENLKEQKQMDEFSMLRRIES
ncbi:MAG: flagellar FliJ family protein [Rickettsiales bacterium]